MEPGWWSWVPVAPEAVLWTQAGWLAHVFPVQTLECLTVQCRQYQHQCRLLMSLSLLLQDQVALRRQLVLAAAQADLLGTWTVEERLRLRP